MSDCDHPNPDLIEFGSCAVLNCTHCGLEVEVSLDWATDVRHEFEIKQKEVLDEFNERLRRKILEA